MTNNILSFFKQERATYYDFSTGKLKNIWPMLMFQLCLAILCALFFEQMSDSFLASALTVYSIFIGFSFSVLFNLVSTKVVILKASDHSLEKKPRIDKVNKLRDELFYNIIYFSVSGLALVLLILLLVLFADINFDYLTKLQPLFEKLTLNLKATVAFIELLFRGMFFLIFLNSLWSFFRIISRLNFYFTERLELSSSVEEI